MKINSNWSEERRDLTIFYMYFFFLFQTKVKLQRVRLMAEIFGCDPGMTFQKSTLSQIIMNSKSKECGPLRLHDVNPAASCHQSRTKIFILSFFKLVIILMIFLKFIWFKSIWNDLKNQGLKILAITDKNILEPSY